MNDHRKEFSQIYRTYFTTRASDKGLYIRRDSSDNEDEGAFRGEAFDFENGNGKLRGDKHGLENIRANISSSINDS